MKKTLIILLSIVFVFTSSGIVYAAEEAVSEQAVSQEATEIEAPAPSAEPVELPATETETAPADSPPSSQPTQVESTEEPNQDPGLDEEEYVPYNPEQSSLNNFKKEAGLSGSLRVDNFTGAAVYNLNLEIPAGRKGIQPSLNLYYNSHDKSPGSWVGLGWSLELGSITRSSRLGVNHLYDSNEYILFLNGKSYELVLIDEVNNIYGAKTESDYLRIQYDDVNLTWTVTDTLGNKYYFGQDQTSRLDNINHTFIYKWMLDRVEDLNENYYGVAYQKIDYQIYPQTISYTGHGTTDGPMEVTFNLTDRVDDFTSYASQFEVTTSKLLDNILIKVDGQEKIKYEFDYQSGQNGNTSVLQQVIKNGYQDSQWYSLPANSFDYQVTEPGWIDDTNNWNITPYFYQAGANTSPALVDFNGDSWVDVSGSFHGGDDWYDSNWNFPANSQQNVIGDVNGDKYPDIIAPVYNGGQWHHEVYVNNKVDGFNQGFGELPFSTYGSCVFQAAKISLVDVNGDGLDDLIQAWSALGTQYRDVYLNNGEGWEGGYGNFPAYLASCSGSPYTCETSGTLLVDINGDGLVDVFTPEGVYLNTGNGWEQEPNQNWVIPTLPYGFENAWKWGGARLTDVNSDGLIDIAIAAQSYFLQGGVWDIYYHYSTYLNTGSDWQQNDDWNLPISIGYNQTDMGVRLMDINNDGLIDEVQSYDSNLYPPYEQAVHIETGNVADLLSIINNGYGGETTIEYGPSAEYTGTPGEFINDKLPMNLQVVKQITTDNGQGDQSVTTYEYQDGAYYADDTDYTLNQFAGFGIVTQQTGNQIIRSYYHQGSGVDYYEYGEYEDNIYKKGRVFRKEILEQDGANQYILNAKVNTWKSEDLGDSRTFVYLDSTVTYDYESGSSPSGDGSQMGGQGEVPKDTSQNEYLKALAKAQDYIPETEPQLVSQSEDGWSKIYFLGLTPDKEPIYQLQVYSGEVPSGGELDDPPEYISSSTLDGAVVYTGPMGQTWQEAINESSGTSVENFPTVNLYNRPPAGLQGPSLSRIFIPFDTSDLPDEEIEITQLQLTTTIDSVLNSPAAIIVQSDQNTTSLSTPDFGTVQGVLGGTRGCSSQGTATTNLNETAKTWVSQNGFTKLAFRLEPDFSGNTPQSGDRYCVFYMSEVSDPNNRPKLTVTYILANSSPLAPTDLETEGLTNPDDVTDQTPEFTAIYNDDNPGDQAVQYQIQVIEAGGNFNAPLWDSGQQALVNPISVGQRSEEITYGGNSLPLTGFQYFWRIKFWDNGGSLTNEGLWSSGQDYFYMDGSAAPSAPISLLTEGKTNPVDLINLIPSFSAVYTDPNPIDSAKWYQIQVNDDVNFAEPHEWDSQKTLLTNLISNGARSEDIVYAGSQLTYNGVTYYWRIKFWDDEGLEGTEGAWSEAATFAMFDDSTFLTNVEAKGTRYVYDDYGNVVQEAHYGKVNAANNGIFFDNEEDNLKITNYLYAVNPTKYIYSAPKKKTLTDQVSDESSEIDLYYDDLPYGQVEYVNLTKEDLELQTSVYESDYNEYGLVIAKRDPLLNQTSITYDSYNYYPDETTNALSQTVTTEYDLTFGQVTSTEDPNGLVEQRDYDAFGRLTEVRRTDPDNIPNFISLETYEYHDDVTPFWVKKSVRIDNTNWVDSYTYFDGLGRVIQTRIETEGADQYVVASYDYNENGNLARQTLSVIESGLSYQAPNWSTAVKNEYTYDSAGRVLTETTPVGTTTYNYDAWKTTVTDAENNYKNYYRDAYGQLVQVDEVLDLITYPTTYEYNYLGKLTNITDSQGNSRNFEYDSLGRLTSQEEMHIPGASSYGVWTYEYDEASNLISKTDAKNQTVTYTYDDLNRVLTEDSDTTAEVDANYTYDLGTYGIGRLSNVVTPKITTTYDYDVWGRTLSEIRDLGVRSYTTGYTYSLASQPLTITYPDNFIVRYAYNNVGQTNQVFTQELGSPEVPVVDSVNYSPLGQISQINYTNGTVSTMTYDINQAYRLIDKETTIGTTTLQDISYTYDNVGNITQIVDIAPNELAKTSTFSYDDLYRLTHAEITDDFNQTTEVRDFEYDVIGNMRFKSDVGPYEYDYNNPYQANLINGLVYNYDANGNLLKDGTRKMVYDYMDRLTSVRIGENVTDYYYDHSKTRIAKVDNTTHDFKFYPNKYYEENRNSDSSKYVFLGNQRLGIIEKVSGQPSLYLNFADHLNSSSVTTDASGTVTNLIDYFPYGSDRVNIQYSTFDVSYQFTDKELDNESSLNYFGSRYYNAAIGRWTASDPLQNYLVVSVKSKTGQELLQILMNPIALNAYAYSGNNPIRYVDPNGEWFMEWLKGEQTLDDLIIEIGDAAEVLYNNSQLAKWVMDHPYATGVIIGVGTALTATGISLIAGGSLVITETTVITVGFNVAKEYNKIYKNTKGAYEFAKGGGSHQGLINTYINKPIDNIIKGSNSLAQRAIDHLNYIKDPSKYYPGYEEFSKLTQSNQINTINDWYKQAVRFQEEASVLRGLAEELIKQLNK